MQTTEIVERVQERAELDSFQEAHDTVIALLETLALRDLKDEREDFATQLAKELGQVLTTDVPATKERFDTADMVPGCQTFGLLPAGKPNPHARSVFGVDGSGLRRPG
ncbi:hypothetical protein A6F49_08760 [Enteractinococcus helveticum]|uniref:Uncharacterized protein n=1 Tax=Enteractinococcus helveticum TaxID=1837282 RepID=A0A1B7M094_9MICC|nr:DUF2267 domain-containing protein [Enteractinococcus helveticum]OAV61521.1 hypothetical protein A6F49_08760 [Enteractinococcus helveticum]